MEISKNENGDLVIHPLPVNRDDALMAALAGFDDDFAGQHERNQDQQAPM